MLELAAQEGQAVKTSQVRIRHYGFAGSKRTEKFERDIKLLELELQERPGQLYYQIELYRTLLLLSDNRWREVLAVAAENFKSYVTHENPPTPHVALMLETLLQLPPNELPNGFSPEQMRELAERWFGRSAPLLWVLAKQDYEGGRFKQAEARLRKLIDMGKEHSYDRSVGFDPHIFGEEAQLNLAVCLIRQVKLNEASEILESLSASPQYGQAAKQNLSAIKNIHRKPSKRVRGKRKR